MEQERGSVCREAEAAARLEPSGPQHGCGSLVETLGQASLAPIKPQPPAVEYTVRHVHMSRPIAVSLAATLVGLLIVVASTDQDTVSGVIDQQTLVLNVIAQVLLALGLFMYCGFAALHSTQHITSPQERSYWLLATVGLNILGSCWYYLTTYQSFRKAGQSRLMRFRKPTHAS
jgi:hypothetical protein